MENFEKKQVVYEKFKEAISKSIEIGLSYEYTLIFSLTYSIQGFLNMSLTKSEILEMVKEFLDICEMEKND